MLLSNGQGHGPSGFLLHPFTGIFDHLSMGIFDPHSRCFVWVRAYLCLVNRWLWNSKKSQFIVFNSTDPWRNNRSCFKLTLSPPSGARCSTGGCPTSLQMVQRHLHENCYKATFRMWSHGTPLGQSPALLGSRCLIRCKGCLWCGCFHRRELFVQKAGTWDTTTKIMTGVVEAS